MAEGALVMTQKYFDYCDEIVHGHFSDTLPKQIVPMPKDIFAFEFGAPLWTTRSPLPWTGSARD
jgi:hypothetical protein